MKRRKFGILTGLFFIALMIGAETQVESVINVKADISIDVGGAFDGWDADYAGGLLGGLYILPRKKLTITNTPVYQYRVEVLGSGYKGFLLPNMNDLDPTTIYLKSSRIMEKARANGDAYNNGTIDKETFDKRRESLDKESEKLNAESNAVVVKRTYLELEKFGFGVISGIAFTSYKAEPDPDREEDPFYDDPSFEQKTYIPAMISFQHNYLPFSGNMRHIYTEVEVPYKENPKTLTWSYNNTQSFLFYRISGGVGFIEESDKFSASRFEPFLKIEAGLGSYDGFFSIVNTSAGYQHLFNYSGSIFINWCLSLQ